MINNAGPTCLYRQYSTLVDYRWMSVSHNLFMKLIKYI